MKITLLHGALGAAEQVKPLAHALEKKGFEPVILELPGHGNTPLNNYSFTIEGFAEWLKKEIERKDLSAQPFFGFSMGGYVALYLNSSEEVLSEEIITLGTKFHWNKETAAAETKKLNPNKILEKVPKFAEMLDQRHQDWKLVLKQTAGLMHQLGEEALLHEQNTKNIQNKALIMRGALDEMVTAEESERVAEWLPKGVYKELTAVPHPLEQVPPHQIAKEIINFLQ